jgi:hypothetical protein
MSHWLPAVQVLIEQPPLVHASTLHLAPLPVHAISQAPRQLFTVHVAPWHGIVQAPESVQSTLQVAPGRQFVTQLLPGALQSTLHVVLAAHSVVQPPRGQATSQGCDGEPQAK